MTGERNDLDWPSVTINFLAHNRRDALAYSLARIAELHYPESRLELIVVDNASTDGTSDMLREQFPNVTTLINERNIGVSGWNRGFERGAGDYFLVLDDDCYLEPDGLRQAVLAARQHSAEVVSFRVATPAEDLVFTDEFPSGLLSFWGCALLISAESVRTLGGFDPETFIYGHETEFMMRALDAGFRHLYLSEVTAIHMKQRDADPAPGRGFQATYMGNLAFYAARLLQAPDAFAVGTNLLLKSLATARSYPETWPAVVNVVGQLVRGATMRTPVGRSVSRLYRRNFADFAGPLAFARTRAERGEASGDDKPGHGSRRDRFYAQRRHLYPSATSAIGLVPSEPERPAPSRA